MNEVLQIILDSAQRVFTEYCGREVREGAERGQWPRELWDRLTDTGITAVARPEGSGGGGLDVGDTAALIRLAGYYAVPVPLVETIVAGQVLAECGFSIPDGPLSLAAGEEGSTLTATAEPDGGWTVSGLCRRVAWANRVGCVVAAVGTPDGDRVACLDPKSTEVMDGKNVAFEPRSTLRVATLRLPASSLRVRGPGAPSVLEQGAMMRVQQMAGALQRALDLSVEYVGSRIQFGRPIAKFQAVQQQLAVMAGHVAAASAAAEAAATDWETDQSRFSIAVAKARVSEAAGKVAAIAHQVHGAMGFTREHSLHYCTRRLWAWRDEFGNESFWQQRIGAHVLEIGADGLWPFLIGRTKDMTRGDQ